MTIEVAVVGELTAAEPERLSSGDHAKENKKIRLYNELGSQWTFIYLIVLFSVTTSFKLPDVGVPASYLQFLALFICGANKFTKVVFAALCTNKGPFPRIKVYEPREAETAALFLMWGGVWYGCLILS